MHWSSHLLCWWLVQRQQTWIFKSKRESSFSSRVTKHPSNARHIPIFLLNNSHLEHVRLEQWRLLKEINLLQLQPPDAVTRAAMLHNEGSRNKQANENHKYHVRKGDRHSMSSERQRRQCLCVASSKETAEVINWLVMQQTRWQGGKPSSLNHTQQQNPRWSCLWRQVQQSRLLAITSHSYNGLCGDWHRQDEREDECWWWWGRLHLFAIPLRLPMTQWPKSIQTSLQSIMG